jgi:hypothetical protein
MDLAHHKVNSWVAIGLFAAMTAWVCMFYVIEVRKVRVGVLVPDYRIYYEVVE